MSFRSKRSHDMGICACRLPHFFSARSPVFQVKWHVWNVFPQVKYAPSLISMGYHYGLQAASVSTWQHPLQFWNIFIILTSNGCLRATFTLSFYSLFVFASFHPFILSFQTQSFFSHSLPLTDAHTHNAGVTKYDKKWHCLFQNCVFGCVFHLKLEQ